MSDIFISYFHEDRAHAELLAGALEAEGVSVWWDRTIQAGENFDQVIEQALGAATVVMVLWSLKAVKSRWVLNEAEEAAARGILVPVLIEEDIRIPLAFKRIQAADLVGWDGAADAPEFRDLMASLVHRIACRTTPESPGVAVQPPVSAPDLAADRPARIDRPPLPPFLYRRIGLTALLLAVFVANVIETTTEMELRSRYGTRFGTGLPDCRGLARPRREYLVRVARRDELDRRLRLLRRIFLPAADARPLGARRAVEAAVRGRLSGAVPVGGRRLSDQPGVLPVLPGAGTLGLPGVWRDAALGPLVILAGRTAATDQRPRQLFSQHPRVAHRGDHPGGLPVSSSGCATPCWSSARPSSCRRSPSASIGCRTCWPEWRLPS